MSYITQRGATGPLSLTANGTFQTGTALATTPGAYGTSPNEDVAQLVGTRWDLNDGREVILVSTTATSNVTPGYLMQDAALISGLQNLAVSSFVAYATLANTDAQVLTTVGNAVTVNQFQGGYVIVNDGGDAAGQGQTLRIKSHLAAASGANVTINLEDSPNEALTTSSKICLVPAHGAGVVVQPTTITNAPCGIGLYPIAASSYGFLVSKGLVSALSDASVASAGNGIAASRTTAGTVTLAFATSGNIGVAAYTAVSAKSYPVYVDI